MSAAVHIAAALIAAGITLAALAEISWQIGRNAPAIARALRGGDGEEQR